jgi:hypothetical protein
MRLKTFLFCCELLLLLFPSLSAEFVRSVAANPGLKTMTATIEGTWDFDVDTGQNTTDFETADLWWHFVTQTERYIEPENGAIFSNLGIVDFDSVTDISLYSLSTARISGSVANNSIPAGTVLVLKTSLGRYAKMRIDSYGNNLDVTIVYQDDGTPFVPEFPSSILLLLSLIGLTGAAVYMHSSKKFVSFRSGICHFVSFVTAKLHLSRFWLGLY